MIEVKFLQNLKASRPIEVTLSGIVIDVKPVQLSKAFSPIVVTLLVKVTDVKFLHPKKAYVPIDTTLYVLPLNVTVSEISIEVTVLSTIPIIFAVLFESEKTYCKLSMTTPPLIMLLK